MVDNTRIIKLNFVLNSFIRCWISSPFFYRLPVPGSRFIKFIYWLLRLPLKSPVSRHLRAVFRDFYRLRLPLKRPGYRLLGTIFINFFFRLLLRLPLKRPGALKLVSLFLIYYLSIFICLFSDSFEVGRSTGSYRTRKTKSII